MTETVLYRSALLTLGRFRCPPRDDRWRRDNVIGGRALAAFPLTSVVIRHEGRDALLANPNHVVFYRSGERYRRALHDERGDDCLFVALEPKAVAALAGRSEIPFAIAPSNARSYLRLRTLADATSNVETLALEETVCEAVSSAVEAGRAVNRVRSARRRSTDTEHRHVAERAKQLLTERTTRRDSLSTLARMLHISEFHLARVFRATTGYTLHGYRTHLRLRAALERLPRDENLTHLATALGFNSHSHFTDTFRTVFGVPPSSVRAASGRRELAELRRILEAPAPAAS